MADSPSAYDVDAASDRIGSALFGADHAPSEPDDAPALAPPASDPPPSGEPPQLQAEDLLPAPASWKKEMHQHWAKMPREAQQYYNEREQQMLNGMQQFNQIGAVIRPYEAVFSQSGMPAYQVIDRLLNAHTLLTQGDLASRKEAYRTLGQNLQLLEEAPAQQPGSPLDPAIQSMQSKLSAIEQGLMAHQQAMYRDVYTKTSQEVDAFASDTKAHPYFNEVAEDMQIFLSRGASLQDAYDKAVWANSVTRSKEQARALTEHEAKLKENARLSALPKRQAKAVNVRASSDGTAPTEPTGRLEDTIKNTLREMRQRVS